MPHPGSPDRSYCPVTIDPITVYSYPAAPHVSFPFGAGEFASLASATDGNQARKPLCEGDVDLELLRVRSSQIAASPQVRYFPRTIATCFNRYLQRASGASCGSGFSKLI